ncbi:hypothetical protein UPYG_G00093260 [Umbra pygmaea]|uniref:Tubulin polyglutamylase TTLL6 n=1 Tax=Umbra pygmaea TaxID=75934 RepID=A0ABD0X3B8_UMBPY
MSLPEDVPTEEKPHSSRRRCPEIRHAQLGHEGRGPTSPHLSPLVATVRTKKTKKKRRLLSINLINCKYESVRRAALRFGLKEAVEGEDWSVCWTDSTISLERYMDMKCYQKINHFPGMLELCRKDMLARNMNRMLRTFPREYNIFPRTWCLPADYNDFQAYNRVKRHRTYICKPGTGSQGRGIYLSMFKDIPHEEQMVCQVYISKPLLIDGFKFDLRMYVLVTSCDPFSIFLYEEGLARFCTTHYSYPTQTNLENIYMHLTNYTINKRSKNFIRDENTGSKRKLSALTCLLKARGCDTERLWADMEAVVIKALVSAQSMLSHSYHSCFPRHSTSGACFEILGFDILIDHQLKPWLIEVNHSPSFTTDSELDREVKDRLLYDTLVLINLEACNPKKAMEDGRCRARERLLHSTHMKRSKEQSQQQASSLERTLSYEDQHLGGFHRIFPRQGGEYDKFLNHSSSLYQKTAASRTREECTREQLEALRVIQGQKCVSLGLQGESAEEKVRRPTVPLRPTPLKPLRGVPHIFPGLTRLPHILAAEKRWKRVSVVFSRGPACSQTWTMCTRYGSSSSMPLTNDNTAPPVVQSDSTQHLNNTTAKLESLGDGAPEQESSSCDLPRTELCEPRGPRCNPKGYPQRLWHNAISPSLQGIRPKWKSSAPFWREQRAVLPTMSTMGTQGHHSKWTWPFEKLRVQVATHNPRMPPPHRRQPLPKACGALGLCVISGVAHMNQRPTALRPHLSDRSMVPSQDARTHLPDHSVVECCHRRDLVHAEAVDGEPYKPGDLVMNQPLQPS